MKINIRTNDTVLTATLLGSKAARDFASLLPLTLTMADLFRREKYARLPRAISEDGKRMHAYELGEIAYWSPGLTSRFSIATTGSASRIPASSSSGRWRAVSKPLIAPARRP
jgi:hypothetical protein